MCSVEGRVTVRHAGREVCHLAVARMKVDLRVGSGTQFVFATKKTLAEAFRMWTIVRGAALQYVAFAILIPPCPEQRSPTLYTFIDPPHHDIFPGSFSDRLTDFVFERAP